MTHLHIATLDLLKIYQIIANQHCIAIFHYPNLILQQGEVGDGCEGCEPHSTHRRWVEKATAESAVDTCNWRANAEVAY